MDIRKSYLKYFEEKGHNCVDGSPLVPDDATLLFTNAGMVPFKSIFTQDVPIPSNPRVVSSQTCLRAGGKHNDLENVGHTARHHTFFEMLGNFSFGDYFKEEAIAYAWEFIVDVLKLDINKLWVTVHTNDNEAYKIWAKHIKEERIIRLGDKDNFWQMGDTGPCGPSSEIFYDQGSDLFNGAEDYIGGDGDRFLEIWNLVFMQYNKDKSGKLNPLPKPSIDTGMGLERVTAILEGKSSNYDSSLFTPLIDKVVSLTKEKYIYKTGASYRVISDHIRSVTFLLAQGVHFSNEGRGYVLRRILRRAVRHGYLLGLNEPFMYKIVDTLVDLMHTEYPYLKEKKEIIKEEIKLEEARFYKTIKAGIELFNKELKNTKDIFSGEVAFKLYDTFGFPLDLTEDTLKDNKLSVDQEKFDILMQEQKQRAKAAWRGIGDSDNDGDFKMLLEEFAINEFIGYTQTKSSVKVLALLDENKKRVASVEKNKNAWIMFDKTPFYALSGGQTGDSGVIVDYAKVTDTRKFFGLNLSKITTNKTININDELLVSVDSNRLEITKHHSATHLIHATLRSVLGIHVEQAGSSVEVDKLRFDFSHSKALTKEELNLIENKVNKQVAQSIPNNTQEMSVNKAKESGAMALFGEKYGDKVRVVEFKKASIELCGGTHVNNTAEIGTIIITKESGVSAGVRRIEAICGQSAYKYMKKQRELLEQINSSLKNNNPLNGIDKLKTQIKTLKEELQITLKNNKKNLIAEEINGVKTIIAEIESGDIKSRIDEIKNENDSIAILLIQKKDKKVLLSAGSKNTSIKAGDWIKNVAPIVGGGGGGRPDFASAGGKDINKIDDAIKKAREYIDNQ